MLQLSQKDRSNANVLDLVEGLNVLANGATTLSFCAPSTRASEQRVRLKVARYPSCRYLLLCTPTVTVVPSAISLHGLVPNEIAKKAQGVQGAMPSSREKQLGAPKHESSRRPKHSTMRDDAINRRSATHATTDIPR